MPYGLLTSLLITLKILSLALEIIINFSSSNSDLFIKFEMTLSWFVKISFSSNLKTSPLKNILNNSNYNIKKKTYILNNNFFNQPHEIVFRSLVHLLKKIGKKYYSPRGKSINRLLIKLGSGEIKKINISGCILEKINNSFIIYKEKWKKD